MTDYVTGILGTRNCSSNFGSYVRGTTGSTSAYGGYNKVASSANFSRIATDNSAKYRDTMSDMQYYFETGRSDEALKLYQELFDSVKAESKNYGYNLDDNSIRSNIDESYKKYTGETLNEEINKHCKNPFVTGLIESIPFYGWFFANSNSDQETKAMKNNEKNSSYITDVAEIAGATVGTAASIAGLGAASGLIGSTSGALGAILGSTGIKAMALGAGKLVGMITAGTGGTALPLIGAALLIGTVIVVAKNCLSNKNQNAKQTS